MDTKTKSENAQIRCKTLNRNKAILAMIKDGVLQVEVARHFGMTKQMVYKINKREKNGS